MGIHPRLPGLTSDREPAEALPAPVLAADAAESRRAFLAKVAVGGAALTLGTQLVPVTRLLPLSGAQEEAVELDADETIVEFLVSIALAGSEAFRAATGSSTVALPEPTVELLEVFGSHHADQGAALLALLPEGHEVVANPGLVEAQTQALSAAGDPAGVLTVLRDLSDAVAATHFAALGELESQPDAAAVGSALPVVVQHSTLISALLEAGPEALLPPVQTEEGALEPGQYPVGDPAEEGEGSTPSSEGGGNTTTTANDGGEGAEPGEGGGTGQDADGTESSGGGATDEGGDTQDGGADTGSGATGAGGAGGGDTSSQG